MDPNSSGKIELFGITFSALPLTAAVDEVLSAIRGGERGHVCVANVDMFTRAVRMPRLRSAMRSARLVVADGMPLIWLERRLGMKTAGRVYGPDFMSDLCRQAQVDRIPVFLYGGTDELLQNLIRVLLQMYPDLNIVGSVAPPMLPPDPPVDPEIASVICKSGARLVFVGLGCPKQELWMYSHCDHLDALTIGVGQAFAQLAGTQPRAPAWMQHSGLEWCFRLAKEPGRLWKRYLIGNTFFVFLAASALLRSYSRRLRGVEG